MWRVLRGQVVIREELDAQHAEYRHIVVPRARAGDDADGERRARTSHVGIVLAMGPPARTARGVEVTPGFAVGDRVVFHWGHLERAWTRPWPEDGLDACWIPQEFVDAVLVEVMWRAPLPHLTPEQREAVRRWREGGMQDGPEVTALRKRIRGETLTVEEARLLESRNATPTQGGEPLTQAQMMALLEERERSER